MPPKPAPPKLTHFLCIPLVTPISRPQLQSSLATFRADVTSKWSVNRTEDEPNAIPPTAIRPLGTLHLTLGVMSLLTTERMNSAISLLKSLNLKDFLSDTTTAAGATAMNTDTLTKKEDNNNPAISSDDEAISEPTVTTTTVTTASDEIIRSSNGSSSDRSAMKITLLGLTSMHTPSQTSVLYAAPVPAPRAPGSASLQEFCVRLREVFEAAGFVVKEARPLMLHATIVNMVYVGGRGGGGGGGAGGPGSSRGRGRGRGNEKRKGKLMIDARGFLERYDGFEWMKDVKLEKVAICRMGAKKLESGDEEYVVEGEVELP